MVLADNGSTDGTADVAREAARRFGLTLRVVTEHRPGKFEALNTAPATIRDEFVITLDADTLLHRTSVRHLVARVRSAAPDVVAVAGAVLVLNSRSSVWAGWCLAMSGHFWVVGPYTLLVLPLTMVIDTIFYRFQRNQVFTVLGLRVRRNWTGFVLYVVVYQIVMSPVAVLGYAQELLGLRRRWK